MVKAGREIWDIPELRKEYIDTMMWSQDAFRERFNHLSYDQLPDYIRNMMESRPRKGVVIKTLRIKSKFWARDDYYNVIPEFQVSGIFEPGDEVKITVELIRKFNPSKEVNQDE